MFIPMIAIENEFLKLDTLLHDAREMIGFIRRKNKKFEEETFRCKIVDTAKDNKVEKRTTSDTIWRK